MNDIPHHKFNATLSADDTCQCGGGLTDPIHIDRRAECHAGKDGDCDWAECPQRKDYQQGCPLANWDLDEEGEPWPAHQPDAAPEVTEEELWARHGLKDSEELDRGETNPPADHAADEPLYFQDAQLGSMMVKMWGGTQWLFKKNPDNDGWMSWREATPEDIAKLDMQIPASQPDAALEQEYCQTFGCSYMKFVGLPCTHCYRDTPPTDLPPAARLSDEQIATLRNTRYIPGVFYDIARAAEDHAYPIGYQAGRESRDVEAHGLRAAVVYLKDEVAALREQSKVEYEAWYVILTMRIKERDAAQERERALVDAGNTILLAPHPWPNNDLVESWDALVAASKETLGD